MPAEVSDPIAFWWRPHERMSKLAPGQAVTFSGRFMKGEKTCLNETSLTTRGSMTDPEFLFVFTAVTASQ